MGNIYTKPQLQDNVNDEYPTEEAFSYSNGDPRSPTVDINRTPLHQNDTFKTQAVTKNIDLTKECFDKYDRPPMNPKCQEIMNQIDPRSPTLDFERTPLAFMLKNSEFITAHNKLNTSKFLEDSTLNDSLNSTFNENIKELQPKNLCKDLCDESFLSSCELQTSENADENLKETGAIEEESEKEISEDKPQTVGLLETNFDYLETDLDTYRRQKLIKQKVDSVSDKPIEQVVNTEQIVTNNIVETNLSDKDPRSPSVGIDRTPILVNEIKEMNSKVKSLHKKSNSQLKEVFRQSIITQQKSIETEIIRKSTKDSLLIYEDVFCSETVSNVNSKTNSNIVNNEGSRTPLASMINRDSISVNNTPNDDNNLKMTNSVKSVNNKSKIPIRVGKISPPYDNKDYFNQCIRKTDMKTLASRRIVNIDTENTPPKPRKACWDKDSSVVL